MPKNINERNFSAIVATIFGAIDAASISFNNENIQNLTVEFNDYHIFVLGADHETLILSLLDLNINLGLFLIEIEESIRNIKEILTS